MQARQTSGAWVVDRTSSFRWVGNVSADTNCVMLQGSDMEDGA